AVPAGDLGLETGYEIHDYPELGPGELALTRNGPEGSIDFILAPAPQAHPDATAGRFAVHVLATRGPSGSPTGSDEHARDLAGRISAELRPVAHALIGAHDLDSQREIL